MRLSLITALILAIAAPAAAFFAGNPSSRGLAIRMAATEVKPAADIAPDFYWKYRLDRLINKKGGDLAFNAKSYPDVSSTKDQYDAYYLDLTLQGKMDGFDWKAEKDISDSEWLSIYKSIVAWTKVASRANKADNSNLPSNDFDLLKQFYPQLSFRDLEVPFVSEEVGPNFPYKNMKELISAAANGKLSIPGQSASSTTSLEATEVRAELAALKDKTMKKIDAIYADSLAFAQNSFPDEESRSHYKKLKSKLSNFPQSPQAWATYRANMEKEVDEMARLASKPDDHHHHHGEEDSNHISPAQEFEQKYGKNLDEMQERMAKYKQNPEGFLEASILEKFGKNGLDIWKKSQEFSSKLSVMTESDKSASEKSFADFLTKA